MRDFIPRRSVVLASFTLPFALALFGCGGRTESQLEADVTTIAAGVQGIANDLSQVPNLNIPAATLAKITSELALIKTNAAEIAGALAPGQPVVTDFVETVDTMAALVQPFFSMAPAVAAVVTAAASLAQVVLQEAGVLSATSTGSPWNMPAAQARMVLAAAK